MGDPKRVELYTELRASVRARCLAIMGNADDAEDMVQEVFRRVAERPAPLDQPLFWMLRVAGNVCRTELRRRRREQRALDREGGQMMATLPAGDAADLVEEPAVLLRFFNRLSPAERALVAHRYRNASSIEDAAADLGMAASTARTLLFRARQKIGEPLLRYRAGLGATLGAAGDRWAVALRRLAARLGLRNAKTARNDRAALLAGAAVPLAVLALILGPSDRAARDAPTVNLEQRTAPLVAVVVPAAVTPAAIPAVPPQRPQQAPPSRVSPASTRVSPPPPRSPLPIPLPPVSYPPGPCGVIRKCEIRIPSSVGPVSLSGGGGIVNLGGVSLNPGQGLKN